VNILAVGLGGALGAVCRYLLGQVIPKLGSGFPLGTFAVNIIGCFVIGLVVGIAGRHTDIDPRLILFLQTGICGGFTTFSTFSLESLTLIEEGRITIGILYIVLSVLLGLFALLAARNFVSGSYL
jgi:protein CrcB